MNKRTLLLFISVFFFIIFAGRANADLFFPSIITGNGWDTKITIINTSDNNLLTGTFKAFNSLGEEISESVPVELAPYAKKEIYVNAEFSDISSIKYIILKSNYIAAGNVKFYKNGEEKGALPATKEINANYILVPHIVSNQNKETKLELLNLSETSKEIIISFNNGAVRTVSINSLEHVTFKIRDLFNGQPQEDIESAVIYDCWGVVGTQFFSNGSAFAGLPLYDDVANRFIRFPYMPDESVFKGEIILFNPSAYSSEVRVMAYSQYGSAVSKDFLIEGNGKLVLSTGELRSILGLEAGDYDIKTLVTDYSNGIVGMALFENSDGTKYTGYHGILFEDMKGGFFTGIENDETFISFFNRQMAGEITLTAYGNYGNKIATKTFSLSSNRTTEGKVKDIFSEDVSNATHIKLTTDRLRLAGMCVSGGPYGTMLDSNPVFSSDYTLYTDLEEAFPVAVTGSGGMTAADINNLIGDINGDGTKEIIVSQVASGPVYAINSNGSLYRIFGEASSTASPALGRLSSGSQGLDVVFGRVWYDIEAYDKNGNQIPGWPIEMEHSNINHHPLLTDIDKDGMDEIFISSGPTFSAYKYDGSMLPGWPIDIMELYQRGISLIDWGDHFGMPAVGDIDRDGKLEIMVIRSGDGCELYAFEEDSTVVPGFPVLIPAQNSNYLSVGDVNHDGNYEIIIGAFNNLNLKTIVESAIFIVSDKGEILHTIDIENQSDYGAPPPVLADLDNDTFPEIIYQTESQLSIYRYDGGQFLPYPGWPRALDAEDRGWSSPVVGDVDGDGLQEILVSVSNSGGGDVHVDILYLFETDGTVHPKFPKKGLLGFGGIHAIADIDLDGRNEIIVRGNYYSNYSPIIYVYDLHMNNNEGKIEWGQFGRDFRHTGYYPSIKRSIKSMPWLPLLLLEDD